MPVTAEQPRPLPQRLNLENQRKRARALLKAARAGDPRAVRRLTAAQADVTAASAHGARWSLHHAQHAIARELGYKSWPKLKAQLEGDDAWLKSALVAAAHRALEMDADRPLFVDPLARALAGKRGFELRRELSSTSWPPYAAGPPPEQSIVTRYYDDALQAAVRGLALTQIVLLGAGLDARAFRLAWPARLVLFEVDDGAVFDRKEAVLRAKRAKPTCDRRVVRADLAGDWASRLLAAGFDPRRKAAFLPTWVAQFDAPTVGRFFRALADLAAESSWLGLALVSAATIESPFLRPLLEKHVALGYPEWRFGVRDPETFLAAHGWHAECTVLGAPDASYGRWRYAYVPRTAPDHGIPRTYLAAARRARGAGNAP